MNRMLVLPGLDPRIGHPVWIFKGERKGVAELHAVGKSHAVVYHPGRVQSLSEITLDSAVSRQVSLLSASLLDIHVACLSVLTGSGSTTSRLMRRPRTVLAMLLESSLGWHFRLPGLGRSQPKGRKGLMLFQLDWMFLLQQRNLSKVLTLNVRSCNSVTVLPSLTRRS